MMCSTSLLYLQKTKKTDFHTFRDMLLGVFGCSNDVSYIQWMGKQAEGLKILKKKILVGFMR